MPRKSREERINTIFEKARKIGMEERYAHVLAKVSVRRRLDGRVVQLLSNYGADYATMIEMNNDMWEDPVGFYKRALGNRKLRRFATLSLTYSDASPVRMVLRILKDVKLTREHDSFFRKAGIFERDESMLDDYDLFWDLRADEKMEALLADMSHNGVNRECMQTILDEIGYENLPTPAYNFDGPFDKLTATRSIYKFFESPQGLEYRNRLRREKRTEERTKLIREITSAFSEAYRNDREINEELPSPTDVQYLKCDDTFRPVHTMGFRSDYTPIVKFAKED